MIRFPLLTLTLACTALFTQLSATVAAASVTTTNTEVEVHHLKLMLKPMTLEELEVEAGAWRDLVKTQAEAISESSIRLEQAETAAKNDLSKELSTLTDERARLAVRAQTAIDAFAAKGGDVEALQKYLAVVTSAEINASDATGAALALKNWLTSGEGGLRWGGNLLKFLAILFVSQLVARLIARIARRALAPTQLSDLLKNFVVNAARKLIFLLGVLIALSFLGVNIGPLVAGVGVVGFVVGFALQDTLSNFASGFMILLYRPYDVGDVVDAAGVSGIVDDMNLVSTSIKTFDNRIITVPNSSIWGGTITNATGSDTRRVDLTFGIGYSDDIAKAEKVLQKIVANQDKVLTDPAPTIQLHELADSSVNFVVRPWANTADYWTVYWGITRAVKERFDAESISIPFPQQDVHLHQVTGSS